MGKIVWNIKKQGDVVINIQKEEYNEEGNLILMVEYDVYLTLHGWDDNKDNLETRIWKDVHIGEKSEVSFKEMLEVYKKIEYMNELGATSARLVD